MLPRTNKRSQPRLKITQLTSNCHGRAPTKIPYITCTDESPVAKHMPEYQSLRSCVTYSLIYASLLQLRNRSSTSTRYEQYTIDNVYIYIYYITYKYMCTKSETPTATKKHLRSTCTVFASGQLPRRSDLPNERTARIAKKKKNENRFSENFHKIIGHSTRTDFTYEQSSGKSFLHHTSPMDTDDRRIHTNATQPLTFAQRHVHRLTDDRVQCCFFTSSPSLVRTLARCFFSTTHSRRRS